MNSYVNVPSDVYCLAHVARKGLFQLLRPELEFIYDIYWSTNLNKPSYCISESYRHREEIVGNFIDHPEMSSQYQVEVYQRAESLFQEGRVLDIGCGIGDKLCKHFPAKSTLGLELEPTLSLSRKRHPDRAWQECDFSNPPRGHFSLGISADVIEHIYNPDDFLDFVMEIDFDVFIMSTPDRDTLSQGKCGPPENRFHYREWSFTEFREYIGGRFHVLDHYRCKEPYYMSQAIVFRKAGRQKSPRLKYIRKAFKALLQG